MRPGLELARVDRDRVGLAAGRRGHLLDRLAVDLEGDLADLAAADGHLERLALATRGAREASRARSHALAEYLLLPEDLLDRRINRGAGRLGRARVLGLVRRRVGAGDALDGSGEAVTGLDVERRGRCVPLARHGDAVDHRRVGAL